MGIAPLGGDRTSDCPKGRPPVRPHRERLTGGRGPQGVEQAGVTVGEQGFHEGGSEFGGGGGTVVRGVDEVGGGGAGDE